VNSSNPEVIGHEKEREALLHLAQSGRLPTAMAFVGPAGIGKNLVAKEFAEKILGRSFGRSFHLLEPAGEWIKVDQIHEMLRVLSLKSLDAHRLVVIDRAEKLNPQSSNALLKALEEPPENTHFILITSALAALLPTIRSRVQVFRFFPLKPEQLKRLVPEAQDWLLQLARGQVSEAEEWQSEDPKRLLESAEAGLRALAQRDLVSWGDFLGAVKERSAALRVVRIFQFFFRDLVQNEAPGFVALPFTEKLSALFDLDSFGLCQAWQKAFDMETAIQGNGDRSLILQNYFYEFQALRV
jgi:DNA polymerase III delta prime subunit